MDKEVHAAASGALPERVYRKLTQAEAEADMLKTVILLSMVTACISFSITEMKLFKGVRERVNKWGRLLGDLFCCSYCFGHWVAFGLVGVYRPRLFSSWLPFDLFLTALVIAWMAAFQSLLLDLLMKRAEK